MRRKSIIIGSLALKAEYMHQIGSFGAAFCDAYRIYLPLYWPVTDMLRWSVGVVQADSIVNVWCGSSCFC